MDYYEAIERVCEEMKQARERSEDIIGDDDRERARREMGKLIARSESRNDQLRASIVDFAYELPQEMCRVMIHCAALTKADDTPLLMKRMASLAIVQIAEVVKLASERAFENEETENNDDE